jgi:outer membrane protein assembly factor BamD (BamD/ComL family)
MPPKIQIDLANQLYADGKPAAAAAAYEAYLAIYPTQEGADQIRLLLGVIYTHAHPHPTRAKELLTTVLPRLRDPAQKQMAESDLAYLAANSPLPG